MKKLTLEDAQQEHLKNIRSSEKAVVFGHVLVEIPQFTERLASNGINLVDLTAEKVTEVLKQYAQEDLKSGNLKLAGDVVNASTYLNRLPGRKIETIYAGPVGSGDLGKKVTEILNQRGIQTMPYANETECPVGIYGIEKTNIDGEIDNQPHYARKESERALLSNPDHVDLIVATARETGIFYTSLIPLGLERNFSDFRNLLKRMHEEGIPVMFDTNYRKYVMEKCFPEANNITPGAAFCQIAPYVDLLSAGKEDMQRLFPDLRGAQPAQILPYLHDIHTADTIIALKSGGNGTFALNHKREVCRIPTPKIQVHDTTGGGDSWNARLISSIRNGADFPTAITNASQFASVVVQRTGAIISQAEINEICS